MPPVQPDQRRIFKQCHPSEHHVFRARGMVFIITYCVREESNKTLDASWGGRQKLRFGAVAKKACSADTPPVAALFAVTLTHQRNNERRNNNRTTERASEPHTLLYLYHNLDSINPVTSLRRVISFFGHAANECRIAGDDKHVIF